ncbi:MAG: adenosylcobinamide-GDP ribazoletransferase [Sulfolobales archaeon]
MRFIGGFLALISFLTIYPVPSRYRSIYDAAQYFPLAPIVGLLRGAPISLLSYVLAKQYPEGFIAGIIVAFHMLIQGFLHVDGFIDYSEALLAHRFGRDARDVMKDRYRGSYGVSVAALYIVLLYTSISSAPLEYLPVILLLGEVIEGASMVITLWLGYEEPYNGLGRIFKERLRARGAIASLIITSAIYIATIYLMDIQWSIYPFITCILSTIVVTIIANRIPGYVSGDIIGFSGELCYLVFIASWVFL